MNILRISCSPHGYDSESHRLSDKIIRYVSEPDQVTYVTDRMIGVESLPHIDRTYTLPVTSSGQVAGSSIAMSEELIEELENADALVLATPMHNMSVPSVLKAWIDLVVRAGRTFQVTAEGKIGSLRDRPVFVSIASGGRFSGPQARQMDFLTSYLRAILGTIGLRDITFFSIEGTGLGPAFLEVARRETDLALHAHFASLKPLPLSDLLAAPRF